MATAAAGPVILEGDKLLKLSTVIYYKEFEVISGMNFASGTDEVQHRKDSQNCRDSVVSLMNDGAALVQKYENDKVKGVIARDIYAYIQWCCNSALQTVSNFTVRSTYFDKIKSHVRELIAELEGADPGDTSTVSALANGAVQYKNNMLHLVKIYRSNASDAFSQNLKDQQISFDQLVTRYKGELGFSVPFSELIDEDKTRVYDLILQKSGRGGITIGPHTPFGIAVFVFKVAYMVWDVVASQHPMESGVRDAVNLAAGVAGSAIGDIVEAAVSTDLLVGIEASELFVSLIGMATGFVVGAAIGFVIGAVAGAFLDLIFGSGGATTSLTDGHIFYVADLPDGVAVARSITHD